MYNYGVSLSNTPPTPFPSGGFYLGKLVFPKDYPFKPPRIMMITPNGRFQTNTRLCLSISDFHPDTWNPAWSVATILTGLLSFMVRWVVLCVLHNPTRSRYIDCLLPRGMFCLAGVKNSLVCYRRGEQNGEKHI